MAHDVDALLDGVYDKLAAVQTAGTFYDDLGGRIYRHLAPDDAVEPLAVISLVTDLPERIFGNADINADVDITIHGLKGVSEAAVLAIHAKLLAFDGDAITITGHAAGTWWVTDRAADIQIVDKRFQITSSFQVDAKSD
jgi:hypothetical protein